MYAKYKLLACEIKQLTCAMRYLLTPKACIIAYDGHGCGIVREPIAPMAIVDWLTTIYC